MVSKTFQFGKYVTGRGRKIKVRILKNLRVGVEEIRIKSDLGSLARRLLCGRG